MTPRFVRHKWALALPMTFGLLGCAAPKVSHFPTVEIPIEAQPEKEEIPEPSQRLEHTTRQDIDLPDPKALNSAFQLDYVIGYENGEMSLVSQKAVRLQTPKPTLRRFGRFALELWVGQELLERVRFDFPLLGAGAGEEDVMEAGLSAQVKVRVPEVSRARRARVIDRKSGATLKLPWPPLSSNYRKPTSQLEN